MKKLIAISLVLVTIFLIQTVSAQEKFEDCVKCHTGTTPKIVEDWKASKHSKEDTECFVCHRGTEQMGTVHTKMTRPTPEICNGCHADRGNLLGKINIHSLVAPTPAPPKEEKKPICGPTAIVVVAILPVLLYSLYRKYRKNM